MLLLNLNKQPIISEYLNDHKTFIHCLGNLEKERKKSKCINDFNKKQVMIYLING